MKRPEIHIEPSRKDRVLELIARMLLVMVWVYSVYLYSRSPEIIPAHYNLRGEVDRYGHRSLIFILAGIATFLFVLFTYLQRIPHTFNYPVKITGDNAGEQYRNGVGMIRMLKASICIIFLVVLHAIGSGDRMQAWLIPIIILMSLVPVFYYIVRMLRGKDQIRRDAQS